MVNIEAGARQALGTHFISKPEAEERDLVDALLRRKLTRPPHKTWSLPEEPTWTEDPFKDGNWQFQYHMLRWLDPLRRSALRGDEASARMWEHYARSWVSANPPGGSKSKWAWIDMTDGIRALELCHGLELVGEQSWIVSSLEDHVRWLSNPANLKTANHGMHQNVGLFVAGAALEDKKAMELAVERLNLMCESAWDAQGINEEGSVGYHRQNYLWWSQVMRRLDLEGVPRPAAAERMALAPEAMAHETIPLGRFVRIGDTDGSSPRDIGHPFTDYVSSKGTSGEEPPRRIAIYDAGYAYVRSGWGTSRPFAQETFLSVTFGSQIKPHGHRDGGGITFCRDGVSWIEDQGRFHYGSSPTRRYVTSRDAHNVIVIPERAQIRSREVDLVHREETSDHVDLIFSDATYRGVKIVRRVVYLEAAESVIVIDEVAADEPVEIEQRWHINRTARATADGTGFQLSAEGKSMPITLLSDPLETSVRRGEENPMIGWTSSGWKKRAQNDVATFHARGRHRLIATLLGPWDDHEAVSKVRANLARTGTINLPIDQLLDD